MAWTTERTIIWQSPLRLKSWKRRVRALIRRGQGSPEPTITLGQTSLDRATGAVYVAGHLLDLTRRERAVLETLLVRVGTVVPKSRLTADVFDYDDSVAPNALEVYIGRLRRKLENSGVEIITVRGLGISITPGRMKIRLFRPASLKRRLLLTLLLPLGCIMLALGISGAWLVERVVQGVSDRVLSGSLQAISETLSMEEGYLTLDLPPSALGMLENSDRDNVYYSLRYRGKLITGYPELSAEDANLRLHDVRFSDSNFTAFPFAWPLKQSWSLSSTTPSSSRSPRQQKTGPASHTACSSP